MSSSTKESTMNTQDVKNLTQQWQDALLTEDPEKVVQLYSESASLIPTLSNDIRTSQDERRDYFVSFLQKKPQCKIIDSRVQCYEEVATHEGKYEFSFSDNQTAIARFTFVYKKYDSSWLIVHHHSSLDPEN